jgi:lipopolysaccharide/colanic/teichoic acid biosynthesis glycosyltransferase
VSAQALPLVPAGRTGRVAKRAIDLTLAVLLAVALAPVFVLLAILIKADSRGPVFYGCPRIGKGGRQFAMYKFRKMADRATGPAITVAGDSRFTRVGSQLARFKLDELPQLINVVRGEMSLVGPRPEDARYVNLHGHAYAQILTVLPGVTGLSQLAFARESAVLGSEAPLEVYVDRILPQKVEIDLLYAAHRSLAMDLRILRWTAVAVFARREVAVNRNTCDLGLRRRPPHRPSDVAA